MYGLRIKGNNELLKVECLGNEDHSNCGSYRANLEKYFGDIVWLTEHKEVAERVMNNSPAWYNSDLETPAHNIEVELLEVVEVTLTIDGVVQ